MPVRYQDRRKVTMPNGKWTTRERTKLETACLKAKGEHHESTEQNDLDHIAHIRSLPPNELEDRRRRPKRTKSTWPAIR